MLTFSTTDTIDGSKIYEPLQDNNEATLAPILDENSGMNSEGVYKFEVVNTRLNKKITYPFMTAEQLNYMMGLVYDGDRPKEFSFTTEWCGSTRTFKAYIGSNISFKTVIKGQLYADVTFNISGTGE